MNPNPSEALLADILVTLANAARRAHDDAELQEVLVREFGCSVESQRTLASIHPGMFRRVSFLSKIMALAIRLFANMLAGHVIIFALLGLVLIFGFWALPMVALVVLLYFFELFICVFQAYIFTLLSAAFIGQMYTAEH